MEAIHGVLLKLRGQENLLGFFGGSGMILKAGAEAYLSTDVASQDLIATIQRIGRTSRVRTDKPVGS